MKNIIVGILTLVIIFAGIFTAMNGGAFQGGEAGKIVEDLATFKQKEPQKVQEESRQEDDQLKALKDKAGSMKDFEVSVLYKSKCASCHGVNGKGIIGPNIFGQTSEEIYKKLVDYKSGRIENDIMKGLLMNLSDEEFKSLSAEIGEFGNKAK